MIRSINKKNKALISLNRTGRRTRLIGKISLEFATIILFLLFMVPFAMVVLNSAKTSREIIFNAIAMPSS